MLQPTCSSHSLRPERWSSARGPEAKTASQFRFELALGPLEPGAGRSARLISGKFARKNSVDLGKFALCFRKGSAQNVIRFLIKAMEVSSPLRYCRYWSVNSSARAKLDCSI